MDRAERREFVRKHRTAVFGYAARATARAVDRLLRDRGDDLLVSTMGARAKAKAVDRLGKVSLCVLDEQWPPSYLVVYCRRSSRPSRARRRPDDAIAGVMAASRCPSRAPARRGGRAREGRVVVRLTPYATFHSPPKHVHDDERCQREAAARPRRRPPW
jgi:hypothetical protein